MAGVAATIAGVTIPVVAGFPRVEDTVAAECAWAAPRTVESLLNDAAVTTTTVAADGVAIVANFRRFYDAVSALFARDPGSNTGEMRLDDGACLVATVSRVAVAIVTGLIAVDDAVAALFAELARDVADIPRVDD